MFVYIIQKKKCIFINFTLKIVRCEAKLIQQIISEKVWLDSLGMPRFQKTEVEVSGTLEVFSEQGMGTTVVIMLPVKK